MEPDFDLTGQYTLGENYSRPALGAQLRASQFAQVGVQAGYEIEREQWDVGGYFGIDLTAFLDLDPLDEPE